jgi:hypothetical protein
MLRSHLRYDQNDQSQTTQGSMCCVRRNTQGAGLLHLCGQGVLLVSNPETEMKKFIVWCFESAGVVLIWIAMKLRAI